MSSEDEMAFEKLINRLAPAFSLADNAPSGKWGMTPFVSAKRITQSVWTLRMAISLPSTILPQPSPFGAFFGFLYENIRFTR